MRVSSRVFATEPAKPAASATCPPTLEAVAEGDAARRHAEAAAGGLVCLAHLHCGLMADSRAQQQSAGRAGGGRRRGLRAAFRPRPTCTSPPNTYPRQRAVRLLRVIPKGLGCHHGGIPASLQGPSSLACRFVRRQHLARVLQGGHTGAAEGGVLVGCTEPAAHWHPAPQPWASRCGDTWTPAGEGAASAPPPAGMHPPTHLQHHALLRVDQQRLAGGDAKGGRVKGVHALQKPGWRGGR